MGTEQTASGAQVPCISLLALRIRNAIAAREFNAAQANQELSRDGWLWDHAARDREFAAEIDALFVEANAEHQRRL